MGRWKGRIQASYRRALQPGLHGTACEFGSSPGRRCPARCRLPDYYPRRQPPHSSGTMAACADPIKCSEALNISRLAAATSTRRPVTTNTGSLLLFSRKPKPKPHFSSKTYRNRLTTEILKSLTILMYVCINKPLWYLLCNNEKCLTASNNTTQPTKHKNRGHIGVSAAVSVCLTWY